MVLRRPVRNPRPVAEKLAGDYPLLTGQVAPPPLNQRTRLPIRHWRRCYCLRAQPGTDNVRVVVTACARRSVPVRARRNLRCAGELSLLDVCGPVLTCVEKICER